MKRDINDERYRIPGTHAYSLSKWSRENEPKPLPKYKVGDVVRVVIEDEIVKVGEDCDGTTLYGLMNHGFGYSENNMELAEEVNPCVKTAT